MENYVSTAWLSSKLRDVQFWEARNLDEPLMILHALGVLWNDIKSAPTAEVVPKSEVDRLNAVMKDIDEQRAYTINMLGENLENAKAEVERLQAENEKLTIKMNAYGLTAKRLKEDVDRLQEINNSQVEDVRLAKQEVVREVLALVWDAYQSTHYDAEFEERLDKIEKKYTGGKT